MIISVILDIFVTNFSSPGQKVVSILVLRGLRISDRLAD